MKLIETILPFLFAFLAGHCLFLSIILFRIAGSNTTFLGALLLLLLLRVGKSVLSLAIPESALVTSIIGLAAMAAMGPVLITYLQGMFRSGKSNRGLILLNLVPAFFSLFFVSWKWINLGYYLFTVHLLSYIIYSGWFLFTNRDLIKTDNIRFKWASFLLIGFCLLWITFFAQLFAYNRIAYLVVVIASIILSYGLSLWAFTQQKLFTGERRKKETDPEDYAAIRSRIEQLMQEEIFVDPLLNLSSLSKLLNKPPYLVSRAINDQFHKTFPELLLHYRIKKAEELLTSAFNKTYTVEGIAYESGFSTLSAFYTAFKKETGMTPTQYKSRRGGGSMKIA